MLGLTSITFRNLTPEALIQATLQAGLDGIEWGGDIHVPPDNLAHARAVALQTRAAGLQVLSYGSYFRLLNGPDWQTQWQRVVDTACQLGCSRIRIWAGTKGSQEADEIYYFQAAEQLHACCQLAEQAGRTVGLEYHRGTLTDTWESAARLLRDADSPILTTYWQPNPDLTMAQQLREIQELAPKISAVHVFQWTKGNERHPLSHGLEAWRQYQALLSPEAHDYIMEFVQGDSLEQFYRDAQFLKTLVSA